MFRRIIYISSVILCLTVLNLVYVNNAHALSVSAPAETHSADFNCFRLKTEDELTGEEGEDPNIYTAKFKISEVLKDGRCTFQIDGEDVSEDDLEENGFEFCGRGKGEPCEGVTVTGDDTGSVGPVGPSQCWGPGSIEHSLAAAHCHELGGPKCEFTQDDKEPNGKCDGQKKKKSSIFD